MTNVKPEYLIKDNDLEEAHRLISVANEAVDALDSSIRREFRHVRDALLDLSSALIVITHKIEHERKERENR